MPKRINVCCIWRVKGVKVRSLGKEGYDLSICTVGLAQRHHIFSYLLCCVQWCGRFSGAKAVQKMGLQREKC